MAVAGVYALYVRSRGRVDALAAPVHNRHRHGHRHKDIPHKTGALSSFEYEVMSVLTCKHAESGTCRHPLPHPPESLSPPQQKRRV